jgi:hypothetical protein
MENFRLRCGVLDEIKAVDSQGVGMGLGHAGTPEPLTMLLILRVEIVSIETIIVPGK